MATDRLKVTMHRYSITVHSLLFSTFNSSFVAFVDSSAEWNTFPLEPRKCSYHNTLFLIGYRIQSRFHCDFFCFVGDIKRSNETTGASNDKEMTNDIKYENANWPKNSIIWNRNDERSSHFISCLFEREDSNLANF